MNEVVKKARDLISNGKLEKALDYLLALEGIESETQDTLRILNSKFERLKSETRLGTIRRDDAELTRNQITHSLMGILRELGEGEVTEGVTSTDSNKIKISFFASNPQNGMGDLKLNEEFEKVKESLRRSEKRDSFVLTSTFALDAFKLYRSLLDEKPNIVHFAGHGVSSNDQGEGRAAGTRSISFDWEEDSGMAEEVLAKYTGGIALKNPDGKIQIVWAEALSELFKQFADHVQCVFLNACHSELQAEAMIKHVDYVIGMNRAVPDQTAMNFSLFFYDAMGAGETIEESFAKAQSMLKIMGLPGSDIPKLIKRA